MKKSEARKKAFAVMRTMRRRADEAPHGAKKERYRVLYDFVHNGLRDFVASKHRKRVAKCQKA